MSATPIRLRAPAKVNLGLRVLGRRADGFHELDTVLMALELGDVLEVRAVPGSTLSLEVRGPAAGGVLADESNLVLRAARATREHAAECRRRPGGASFVLEKHVPAAAGLGGGSADAAAAVLACAHLWELDPDDPALLARLAALGSDCAFFLAARRTGLARCLGRGERVEPLPTLVLPWSLALLTPAFGCATADVYRAFTGGAGGVSGASFDAHALARLPLHLARARLVNDLERPARLAYPALEACAEILEEASPGAFRLAGSGSSWFGFFPDAGAANEALLCAEEGLRARRYGLRGRWVLPGRSRGLGFA